MNEARATAELATACPSKQTQDPPRQAIRLAGLLFVFLVSLFSLTGSQLHFGYEGSNIAQSEALLRGTLSVGYQGVLLPMAKGGLMDVAQYLPFTAIKLFFEHRQMLLGLRQIIYVFTVPLFTALLCLAFFGIALEVYQRARTAAALTLLLAMATLIWPYAKFGMETQQTLWFLVAVWGLVRYARTGRAGSAAGCGVGLMLLINTKATGAILALLLGLALVWAAWVRWRDHREPPWRAVGLGLAFGVVGSVILLIGNQWRFSGWLFAGRYTASEELTPMNFPEELWIYLASPNKNLWLFAPPIVLALPYWRRFWRAFPALHALLVLLAVFTWWLMHQRTTLEEVWGVRRLHFIFPILLLPAGYWWERRCVLKPLWRLAGQTVIAIGFLVQVVGVLFDYTKQVEVIRPSGFFTQENIAYQPQLNHLRFNLHLLESTWYRHRTGRSLAFIYENNYINTCKPEKPLPNFVWHDLQNGDKLDLWYLQQRAVWADRPYWFATPSAWLVVVFAAALLVSGAALLWMGRPERPGMNIVS